MTGTFSRRLGKLEGLLCKTNEFTGMNDDDLRCTIASEIELLLMEGDTIESLAERLCAINGDADVGKMVEMLRSLRRN